MDELLFHSAYEDFYAMARTSAAFAAYCRDAFGEDFSQDGFSDVRQIARVLEHVQPREDLQLLDVGCGNGKMLAWLHGRLGGTMHGFDTVFNAPTSQRMIQSRITYMRRKFFAVSDEKLL